MQLAGTSFNNNRARTDAGKVTNMNVAQHLSPGPHDHPAADGGVAFAGFFAGASQGHALVDQGVVAEQWRFRRSQLQCHDQ